MTEATSRGRRPSGGRARRPSRTGTCGREWRFGPATPATLRVPRRARPLPPSRPRLRTTARARSAARSSPGVVRGAPSKMWHAEMASPIGTYGISPGDVLIAAVAAGGRVVISGPGGVSEVVMTRPGWLRVATPADAGARLAAVGHASEAMLSLEGVTAGPWLPGRRLPPPSPVPGAAPAAAPGHAADFPCTPRRHRATLRPQGRPTCALGYPVHPKAFKCLRNVFPIVT